MKFIYHTHIEAYSQVYILSNTSLLTLNVKERESE